MIRLLIADDHPLVRRGLKDLLADTTDITIVAEACDGHEVMPLIEAHSVDIVLLDLNMPRKSGLETLIEVKQRYPTLPVLIISGHCVEQYATRLGRLGAAGFVSKQDAPEQLIEAIHRALSHRQPAAGTVGECNPSSESSATPDPRSVPRLSGLVTETTAGAPTDAPPTGRPSSIMSHASGARSDSLLG